MSIFLKNRKTSSVVKKVLTGFMAFLLIFAQTAAAAAVDGTGMPPSTLKAPQNLSAELKESDGGVFYFGLKWTNTEEAEAINTEQYAEAPLFLQIDFKVGDGKWSYETDGNLINTNSMHDGDKLYVSADYNPIEQGTAEEINIEENVYYLRIRYAYLYQDDEGDHYVYSPFSNIFAIGVAAYSKRLSGQDRIQTAIAICREGWPNSANTVILTRDDNYPDALTGTPLSKKLDAPILFTNSFTLTPGTEAEIIRLKPSKVIILGGTGAVSQAIEDRLRLSYQVQRIGGIDRYETAEKIAKELGFTGKAIVTTGEDFHSALIASPLAAYKGIPILLTLPDSLPSYTKEAIGFVAPSEITVIGGATEVSDKVFNELGNARRIYGADIYQTSVTVAEELGADPSAVFFATGKDFPDALAGSALAAKSNSPILFVNEPFSDYVRQYLTVNKGKTKDIRLLGGEGVITETTRQTIMRIFE